MTRNQITELVIRLLALWFIITSIGSLLRFILPLKDVGFSFLTYIILFTILTTIAILAIKFSDRITKFIWIGRNIDEGVISGEEGNNILMSLIAIIGLYFIVGSLATIIQGLADIFMIHPRGYIEKEAYLYFISRMIYDFLLLGFGILIFCFPEKILIIRFNIKKINIKRIFKRRKINWENLEEE